MHVLYVCAVMSVALHETHSGEHACFQESMTDQRKMPHNWEMTDRIAFVCGSGVFSCSVWVGSLLCMVLTDDVDRFVCGLALLIKKIYLWNLYLQCDHPKPSIQVVFYVHSLSLMIQVHCCSQHCGVAVALMDGNIMLVRTCIHMPCVILPFTPNQWTARNVLHWNLQPGWRNQPENKTGEASVLLCPFVC